MKSYFKHTSGEAFTLDGQDYVGFLHFSNGLPYTGKIDSPDMALLVPKNTFMANFYINQGNFNTTFRNIEENTPFFSNKNDLLNLQGTLNMLRHLNNNNLICFKNLVLGHPTVYQFEENDNLFYGLSSATEVDLIGRNSLRNTIKFSESTSDFEVLDDPDVIGRRNWKFLDDVTTGSFTIGQDEDFVYFCASSAKLIALKGNFNTGAPMVYLDEQRFIIPGSGGVQDYIYNIYHDQDANQLFITLTDTINIYDTTRFEDCQSLESLELIDIIPLGGVSPINSGEYVWGTTEIEFGSAEFIFGSVQTIETVNHPETVRVGGNLRTSYDSNVLSCFNKFSDDLMLTMNLQAFSISALYSIDIRNTDDNILMLYRHNDKSLKLLYIDPDEGTFEDHFIHSIIDTDKYTVKFSGIDSDMFYTTNAREYQTRFISAPEWPAGRLEAGELHYPANYTWGQARFLWGAHEVPFGGSSSEANFYFNLLVSPEIIRNNKMYMLLHNIGRIYALHQPASDRFLNALPLNTVSNYSELACSETSLGLYFNASIFFIVRDVLILFSKSYGSFNIRERSVVVEQLKELTTTTNDFYVNGNETFNVLTIQRILVLINDIQTALLSKSVEK